MEWRTWIGPGSAAIAFAIAIDYAGGISNLQLLLVSILLLAAGCHKVCRGISATEITWGMPLSALGFYLGFLVVLGYTSTLGENSLHYGWLFATFAMIVLLASDFDEVRWLHTFFLFGITGAVSASWGIAEFLSTSTRANGPIIDPNLWGAANNLLCLAALAIYLKAPTRRWWWLAAVALFSLASFSAWSRVGTVVFLVAFGYITLLAFTRPNLRFPAVVAVVVVAVTFATVNTYSSLAEATQHDEGYSLDLQQYGWSQRIAMWNSALAIYADYPLVGTGPGTFKVHYPVYRSEGELNNFGNFVHNDYLQFLAEGGPLFLAFLLAFAFLLLTTLVRDSWRLARGDETRIEACVLAVAMGVVLVQALMNFPLYQLQIQMLMGLLFARYLTVCGLIGPRVFDLAKKSLARALVILLCVGVMIPPVLDQVTRELVLDTGEGTLSDRFLADRGQYVGVVSKLALVRPQNATNRFAMATIYRSSYDVDPAANGASSLAVAAAVEYEAGLRINPYHSKAREYLAELLEQNPWLQQVEGIESTPEALYVENARLFPVYIESWMALAFYLERHGRSDEAYGLLVKRALPFINLRHGEYHTERLRFAKSLLQRAIVRDDRDTLLALNNKL